MLTDPPKEPAMETAKRRWANADIERRFKEARQTFAPDDLSNPFMTMYGKKQKPTAPPAVEVIENDKPKASRFERKLIKDIRAMINEHKQTNVAFYQALIRQQKRVLLLEKIRRVEARIAAREGAMKWSEKRSKNQLYLA